MALTAESVGFLALGRPTFDTELAGATSQAALDRLRSVFAQVVGSAEPSYDVAGVSEAVGQLGAHAPKAVIILQSTFADSTLVSEAADRLECPLVLWAVPEKRTGGRLRLNSFCGINLAAFVLTRKMVDYRWVYRAVDDPELEDDMLNAVAGSPRSLMDKGPAQTPLKRSGSLAGAVIGLVGDRPEGFEPCDFEPEPLNEVFGVTVDRISLDDLFSAANHAESAEVSATLSQISLELDGLDQVDQGQLDKSLRLHAGLRTLAEARGWSGVATRCWPECFTEFGGAVCAPNSMLTSAGLPGTCEADVYGNLTALLLQKTSGDVSFVADLVHLDRETNTAVFWHCGLAPVQMRRPSERPTAAIHSNRRMPLLYEFALRPGRVTIARISRSGGVLSLALGGAEMTNEPLPFSGTAGVAVMDSGVTDLIDTIMGHGLEHHYGIVYGDHIDELERFAADAGLGAIRL